MALDKTRLMNYGLNEAESEEILRAHRESLEEEMAAWRAEHAVPPFEPEAGYSPAADMTPEELKQLSGEEINHRWSMVSAVLERMKKRG